VTDAQTFLSRNRVVREPLLVSLLVLMAVIFFAFTQAYSKAYDGRRDGLGHQWCQHGDEQMAEHNPKAAAESYRTALLYLPQNWDCRLHLAQALMSAGETRQAHEYFLSLWQSQPQNGVVNLELARLAARSGNAADAERYYNDAIFGVWSDSSDTLRQDSVFELIDFYLQRHDVRRAESQLITLAGNLPDSPAQQIHIADLFLQVQDYPRALDFYKRAAHTDPNNLAALEGASKAAIQIGDYRMAETYLLRADREDASNTNTKQQLQLVQALLELDPSEHGMLFSEKARRILRGFEIASSRLTDCERRAASAQSTSLAAPLPAYLEKLAQWKSSANLPFLIHNPDRAEEMFDFSLQAEQAAQTFCGPLSVDDEAMLTLLRKHAAEDNSR
jgi:tetratricopeptide (TPR) repeat protein